MPGLMSWIQRIFGVEEILPAAEATPDETILPQPAQVEPVLPMIAPEMDALRPVATAAVIPAQPTAPNTVDLTEVEAAVEQRSRQAIEALLENESLTSELDDSAARRLLDWGIACARRVTAATAGLDDAAAEALMTPRLRALRQMLRAVNQWVGRLTGIEVDSDEDALQQILMNAAVVYGDNFSLPTSEQIQLILNEVPRAGAPAEQRIASLHRVLEQHA